MAVALPASVVLARLGGGDHIGSVFNRPGLQQHLPVVLAGKSCKGCGHKQNIRPCLGQVAIKLREANVVADRQANPAKTGHINYRR